MFWIAADLKPKRKIITDLSLVVKKYDVIRFEEVANSGRGLNRKVWNICKVWWLILFFLLARSISPTDNHSGFSVRLRFFFYVWGQLYHNLHSGVIGCRAESGRNVARGQRRLPSRGCAAVQCRGASGEARGVRTSARREASGEARRRAARPESPTSNPVSVIESLPGVPSPSDRRLWRRLWSGRSAPTTPLPACSRGRRRRRNRRLVGTLRNSDTRPYQNAPAISTPKNNLPFLCAPKSL